MTAQSTADLPTDTGFSDINLFREVFKMASLPMMITGADLDFPGPRIEFVNPALERLTGYTAEELVGATPRILQGALTERATLDRLRNDLRRTGHFSGETVNYRKDGSEYVVEWTVSPICDSAGDIRHWLSVQLDVTERRLRRRELARSEARFRGLLEGLPQLVWRSRPGGDWIWSSPQWAAHTGQSQAASWEFGWLDVVHPDDRERTMAAWQEATTRGLLDIEHRLRTATDGLYRWFQTRGIIIRTGEGESEWLGTSTDVNDLKRLQEHQRILLAEVQHRARNLLGLVRSIARQAVAASGSLNDFEERFSARLGALSRVQGMLSRDDNEAISLNEIVQSEIEAHGTDCSEARILISGPNILVRKDALQTFALAVHELSTNSVKYGALSDSKGSLKVIWSVERDGEGAVRLEWREHGVSIVPAQLSRRGYGLELIEQALPYDLGADTRFEFLKDGIRCRIGLPLRHVIQESVEDNDETKTS